MKKVLPLLLLTIIALLVVACGPQEPPAETAEQTEMDAETGAQTEDGDTEKQPEGAEATEQVEGSEDKTAEQLPIKTEVGEAIVDSVTIEQQGDEYIIVVSGNLPDGCTKIHESTQTVNGNAIDITLTTARPIDMMCTQALIPYAEEIVIDVSGLAAGEYTVAVNGVTADRPLTIGAGALLPEGDAVSGVVVYKERIALPDDATLNVQLQDTSLADAPAKVLGEVSYVTEGKQVPLPFAISYNPADIQENHTYSLSARITDATGNLLFINATAILVITNGNPTTDVDIPVIQVGTLAVNPEVAVDPLAQAIDKTWQWTGFTDPANGPQEIPQPERYELVLNADGTANIKADCNSVQATYTVDGSNITFQMGPSTLAACPPDSLSDQYIQYLSFVRIFFFDSDDLMFDLMADGGTMRFSEPKAPSVEDLIGPIWQWTDYNTANTSTAVPNPAAYSIQFLPDDVAVIVADCNNILAEYTVDEEGVLSILMGPTTAVFCGEESLDTQFIQGLEAVDGFHLDMEALFLDEIATGNSMRFAVSGAEITGTVAYLQRIALPPDAILEVRVQDVSLADAPAITIGADTYITDDAQVPLPYTVYYNPAFVQENRRYSVSARITDAKGKLLFISDTIIPVITNNSPTTAVEIMVVPAN